MAKEINLIQKIQETEYNFYFFNDIDTSEFDTIFDSILSIVEEQNKKSSKNKNKTIYINLHINSSGGFLTDGMAIIDIIKNFSLFFNNENGKGNNVKIRTFAYGRAYSMAFSLFLIGHERYMAKESLLMFHPSYSSTTFLERDITSFDKKDLLNFFILLDLMNLEIIFQTLKDSLNKEAFNTILEKYNKNKEIVLDYNEAFKLNLIDGVF